MSIKDRIFSRRRTSSPEPMCCRDLVVLVTEYIEGTLSESDRARIDAHLVPCEACGMYLAQMKATLDVMGRIPTETVPDAAYTELSAVFAAWKAEGAPADDDPLR